MATREVEGDMSALLVNDRICFFKRFSFSFFFLLFFKICFPEIGLKSKVDGLNVTNATWPPRDVFMTQTTMKKTPGYTIAVSWLGWL